MKSSLGILLFSALSSCSGKTYTIEEAVGQCFGSDCGGCTRTAGHIGFIKDASDTPKDKALSAYMSFLLPNENHAYAKFFRDVLEDVEIQIAVINEGATQISNYGDDSVRSVITSYDNPVSPGPVLKCIPFTVRLSSLDIKWALVLPPDAGVGIKRILADYNLNTEAGQYTTKSVNSGGQPVTTWDGLLRFVPGAYTNNANGYSTGMAAYIVDYAATSRDTRGQIGLKLKSGHSSYPNGFPFYKSLQYGVGGL